MAQENFSQLIPTRGSYTPVITTDGAPVLQVIDTDTGILHQLVVNSHNSATFRLWDAASTAVATPIGGTYTPTAGSQILSFIPGIAYQTGLVIGVTGTFNGTIITNQL